MHIRGGGSPTPPPCPASGRGHPAREPGCPGRSEAGTALPLQLSGRLPRTLPYHGQDAVDPEPAPSSAHASSPGLGPGVAPASPGRAWRQRHIPGPVSGSGVLPLALTPAGASSGVQLGLAETNQGPGRMGRCVRECVRVGGVMGAVCVCGAWRGVCVHTGAAMPASAWVCSHPPGAGC